MQLPWCSGSVATGMHTLCLVVGASPHRQLHRFADSFKVGRYKSFLAADDVNAMAKHFSVPVDDLFTLARCPPLADERVGLGGPLHVSLDATGEAE